MISAQTGLLGEVYTLAEHEENVRRLKSGEITSDEWRAAYERLKASKHFILAELGRKTMKKLAPRGAGRDNKATVIKRIWEQMLQRYALGRAIAYSLFPNPERAFQEAVDAVVSKSTDETLRKYSEDLRRNAAAFKKAVENPETLEEFETFIRFKGIGKLRPKQAALYEELKARAQAESSNHYGSPKTVVETLGDTPPEVVAIIVKKLDLFEGADVLEPSAGKGSIADGIRKACPSAVITCVEPVGTLRHILRLKGYELMDTGDFLEVDCWPGFDRIAMNPPFEHGQDIEHVRHAFEILKPGGRLVAIMSEGSFSRPDRKTSEFRDWFDEVGGEVEELRDGLFLVSDRPASVKTRIVVINRPEESAACASAGVKGKWFR